MKLETRLEKVAGLLAERAAERGVPGASLAVMAGGEFFETATGVVNASTGVEATIDSVFQIGSITKTFTATQVMQLVDEGRVELDAPIWNYMPEFHVGDADATTSVTVRQLLTHTSGIDGDFFEDTGRGEDCVERYLVAMRAVPQLYPPGAMFSYCNAGFVVLGRLIEKMTAKTWDKALRDSVLAPIGTDKMGTQPEEAILHRAAVGHMPHPETKEPTVVPIWRLNPSNGPAGATPFATARDLLRFARMHLDGGVAAGGARVLSEASARAMRERQVELPETSMASAWGLGFMLFDWGTPVFGHDGGTIGQASFLRIVPEHDAAVSLLTNGGNAQALYRDVFDPVLGELAGISLPPLPEPDPDLALELERYTGRYERISSRTDVELIDGTLRFATRGLRGMMRAMPPQAGTLEPVNDRTFVARLDGDENGTPAAVVFLEPDDAGRPAYVLAGGRVNPRVR
ncbi:MAG: serine hydrolase [Deltaproteobacteria bacterium]|nr:serine hydrolase [Deltaproteobacteria bacterium]